MSTYKLLDANEATEGYALREKEECLKTSRSCSAAVGFSVGLFIQGSSLALNFLLTYASGDTMVSMKSYAIATFFWSLLSGIMGVCILLMLRHMVITTFYTTNARTEESLLEEKEKFMTRIIHNLEKYFSMGAVGGVGFAWVVTDYLLQVRGHIIESALVFIFASLCYCFSSKD